MGKILTDDVDIQWVFTIPKLKIFLQNTNLAQLYASVKCLQNMKSGDFGSLDLTFEGRGQLVSGGLNTEQFLLALKVVRLLKMIGIRPDISAFYWLPIAKKTIKFCNNILDVKQ